MRSPIYTRQFEKDVKRLRKRGKDLEKLKMVIRSLVAGEALDAIHPGRRGYHFIESDWLLIYKVARDLIIFERSGSHSHLFR
jgi:mRNA interferase YafQ